MNTDKCTRLVAHASLGTESRCHFRKHVTPETEFRKLRLEGESNEYQSYIYSNKVVTHHKNPAMSYVRIVLYQVLA